MKPILILLLLEVSLCYNAAAAVSYARNYCKKYNKEYPSFNGDCSNFVSQCLNAGGMNLLDCNGVRNINGKGTFASITTLKSCLKQKGWKESKTRPNAFKAGYPMFRGNDHTIIATVVTDNKILYCGHTADVCDGALKGDVSYYYL